MADFSLERLPATAAAGVATFSRLSDGNISHVAAGVIVKTQDGSCTFVVTPDPLRPEWRADLNAYSLDVGVMSLSLPILATSPGTTGNVLPDTITLIASPLPGIDFVNNDMGTAGGADPESDEAFRKRFQNFFAARSKGTVDAIEYAISQVRRDLNFAIRENVDAAGSSRPGNIMIIVDDGIAGLSSSLFDSISVAVQAVRPVGTMFSIVAAEVIQVQIRILVECPPEISRDDVQTRLTQAIGNYVERRPIGGILSISRIIQLAYHTVPEVWNISHVEANGQSTDMTSTPTSTFKFQSISFT